MFSVRSWECSFEVNIRYKGLRSWLDLTCVEVGAWVEVREQLSDMVQLPFRCDFFYGADRCVFGIGRPVWLSDIGVFPYGQGGTILIAAQVRLAFEF